MFASSSQVVTQTSSYGSAARRVPDLGVEARQMRGRRVAWGDLFAFDEHALVEPGPGAYEGDQVRRVDGAPALLGGLDELERHREGGGPEPGSDVVRQWTRVTVTAGGLVWLRDALAYLDDDDSRDDDDEDLDPLDCSSVPPGRQR